MLQIRHKSDCALHNAPAYEPKPCDCGGEEAMLDALERTIKRGEELLEVIEGKNAVVIPASDFKVALDVLKEKALRPAEG